MITEPVTDLFGDTSIPSQNFENQAGNHFESLKDSIKMTSAFPNWKIMFTLSGLSLTGEQKKEIFPLIEEHRPKLHEEILRGQNSQPEISF